MTDLITKLRGYTLVEDADADGLLNKIESQLLELRALKTCHKALHSALLRVTGWVAESEACWRCSGKGKITITAGERHQGISLGSGVDVFCFDCLGSGRSDVAHFVRDLELALESDTHSLPDAPNPEEDLKID